MAKILRQTTVVRDGMHNGFTDLQYWQGAYWVSYRKGAAHVSMDARAVVAVSADRCRFTEVSTARVRGDVRDPKMFPLSDDRMALHFTSWIEGAGMVPVAGGRQYKPLQQYITFSNNGHDWEPVQPILEKNMWLWRIRPHGGRFYGLIQNIAGVCALDKRPHQLDLAVSDDLISWEVVARVGDGLNESDIYWHEDGEAWIVSRSARAGANSVFAFAQAPYTEWQTIDMEALVNAPIFLAHEGALYVAGRSLPATEGVTDTHDDGHHAGIWRVGRGALERVLHIPACGDCSYPGLIKDPAGRICMSYYSQHAYLLGVCTPQYPHNIPADVYFAELEL